MRKIILLKTAHILCADSVLYKNGSAKETTVIGCHCFLLELDGEYALIDTGIEDVAVANRTKSSADDWSRGDEEYTVKENLDRLGIDCREITKIFLTHAHYDHISGIVHFPNATVYMTRAEYDILYDEENRLREFLKEAKAFLKHQTIVVVEDVMTVGDVQLRRLGGHTQGSMSVEIGDVMFTGDAIFVQENLRRKVPAGFTEDRGASDRILEMLLTYEGKIITSHDYNEVI